MSSKKCEVCGNQNTTEELDGNGMIHNRCHEHLEANAVKAEEKPAEEDKPAESHFDDGMVEELRAEVKRHENRIAALERAIIEKEAPASPVPAPAEPASPAAPASPPSESSPQT